MSTSDNPLFKSENINEDELKRALNCSKLPCHIAIIMDGNGRWAVNKNMPRAEGHRAGVESLRKVVELCVELKINILTVYAFSTENWKRPQEEINILMKLLVEYLYSEINNLHKNGVRVSTIGNTWVLPQSAQEALKMAMTKTCNNNGLTLNLALNYGGRMELVDGIKDIAREVFEGKLSPEDIDENTVSGHLYTGDYPDPDLLIRPSGDFRVSNFLLWQLAYTEFWLTTIMWPDFDRHTFLYALIDFQNRKRRFGGLEHS
ncbi:MAG: isoprenyl transferase [Clostridiales bacterium]|nr:isoprenyl transferase [Clostridiales bacterium]MCF8022170.1 isoprenyl transferase [Clostridiales bacterium]